MEWACRVMASRVSKGLEGCYGVELWLRFLGFRV